MQKNNAERKRTLMRSHQEQDSRQGGRIRPDSSPWAYAVGQVSSRPGQSQTVDAQFPAPSGIGDAIVGVKEGDIVTVNGSFDSISDGLVFTGTFDAPVHAECTRCLKPIDRDWNMDVTAFFPYDAASLSARQRPGGRQTAKDEFDIIDGEDESEDVYPLSSDGEYADFEALLRDTLVEGLPLQTLCRPDCLGLCPQCGINLNDAPNHHHETVDDRFSVLAELKDKLKEDTTTDGR